MHSVCMEGPTGVVREHQRNGEEEDINVKTSYTIPQRRV